MANKHQYLLSLNDKEFPKEQAARQGAREKEDAQRWRREMEDAQPAPEDNLFTAISKWFARNPHVLGPFRNACHGEDAYDHNMYAASTDIVDHDAAKEEDHLELPQETDVVIVRKYRGDK